MSASQTTVSRSGTEKIVGVAAVMTVGVRVARAVPTRADLRFAGTPDQMLGLSLGTVLLYVSSYLAARTVALAWGAGGSAGTVAAAGSARRAASDHGDRAVVADDDDPAVRRAIGGLDADALAAGCRLADDAANPGRSDHRELADAAAYTSLLTAWRQASDLLAARTLTGRRSGLAACHGVACRVTALRLATR